jgi:hypothetical protein
VLDASRRVAGGARDTSTFAALSTAAKNVTSSITVLLNTVKELKPGQTELESTIEAIQSVSTQDLYSKLAHKYN